MQELRSQVTDRDQEVRIVQALNIKSLNLCTVHV